MADDDRRPGSLEADLEIVADVHKIDLDDIQHVVDSAEGGWPAEPEPDSESAPTDEAAPADG